MVSLADAGRFRFDCLGCENFFQLSSQINFEDGKNKLSRPKPDPLEEVGLLVAIQSLLDSASDIVLHAVLNTLEPVLNSLCHLY